MLCHCSTHFIYLSRNAIGLSNEMGKCQSKKAAPTMPPLLKNLSYIFVILDEIWNILADDFS